MRNKIGLVVIGASAMAQVMSIQAEPSTVGEPISAASQDQQAAKLQYWTREMIATAPAMELMIDMGTGGVDTTTLDMDTNTGPAGFVPASRGERGSNSFHKEIYSEDWTILNDEDWGAIYADFVGEVIEDNQDSDGETQQESPTMDLHADTMAGTKNIYTHYDVNKKTQLWKLYPHRWVGKFTFTTPNGSSSCSATAIKNNHIVTAAHCVYDTPSRNRWYSNKVFTPAYRNGNAPYGTFPTAGCRVLTAWVNHSGGYSINSWARHDVAVCKMGKNSAGKTLNQAVGWAGYSWNFGDKQLHFNSGYPARDYNDNLLSGPAQYLRSCTAESFRQTTDTVGMGCKYGRGISGGSWLRGYQANYVAGWVNSVNSGLYLGQPNLYGARFTSNNIKALCDANGC